MEAKPEYESPELVTIGSVTELTQVDKTLGIGDTGTTFEGQETSII